MINIFFPSLETERGVYLKVTGMASAAWIVNWMQIIVLKLFNFSWLYNFLIMWQKDNIA